MPEPEAYVDRREMARRLGISVASLDRKVRDGEIPSCTWGLRARRFLPSAVMRQLSIRAVPREEKAA
jgi:predicted DNA-binding transcriptional regulator AlpA